MTDESSKYREVFAANAPAARPVETVGVKGERFWFEAWARGQGFNVRSNYRALPHGGEYATADTSNAWEGWQARAALAHPRPTVEQAEDSATLTSLIGMFRQREQVGLAKHGTTVDRTDLTSVQWRQHLREELMDALLYSLREEQTMAEHGGEVVAHRFHGRGTENGPTGWIAGAPVLSDDDLAKRGFRVERAYDEYGDFDRGAESVLNEQSMESGS